MARFAYRSGNGSEIITPEAPARSDEGAPRRTSRLHLAGAAETASAWRVMAYLAGGEMLLCLGATRAEAARSAKARAAAGELPEAVASLALERWQGGRLAGKWVWVRPDRGELPRLPRRPTRRSRLVGGA